MQGLGRGFDRTRVGADPGTAGALQRVECAGGPARWRGAGTQARLEDNDCSERGDASAAGYNAMRRDSTMTDERAPGQNEEPQPAVIKAEAPKPARKKDEKESVSPFSVVVGEVYDGPLDLLLDLIRRQDIDIYDIPIAKITAQFLSYVERLKQTDVDAAGDFIYTAALLIHTKSRMLLPRTPAETGEGESEDPRRELVERLLEHERFKN